MQSQRGAFLSILLAVNAVAITFATIVLVFDRDIQTSLGALPDWFSAFVIVLLLTRLVALWEIWNWRRWAVYAYFLLESVEVGMGLFVFTAIWTFPMRLGAVPLFLVLVAIYYAALKPKWQWFR